MTVLKICKIRMQTPAGPRCAPGVGSHSTPEPARDFFLPADPL